MKWILIAIFCFSSASAALVGSNRCTWGPAYWCQGLETAKKCNAVPHCVRMWKAQPTPPVSSTETCLICKGVVQDLKTLIANKKTQEEIKELAGKVCDLMKNEKTAYEVCNTVVVLYLPEVIQMIESDIDSGVICKMLHLCDSSKMVNKLNRVTEVLQKVKTLKTSSSCDECKLAVSMLKSYLSDNATQQELIQFVDEKVCPALPAELKTFCKTFVANELPQMLKSLEQILDPNTICAMIGVCPKTSHKSLFRGIIAKFMKNQKVRANGVECELCQAGVNDIRNTLTDASIQKQIETFLKTEVCTHLGSLEITCQQGVAQYLPLAMKLIIQELDPATVCQELKMCAAAKQPVMKLSPAKPRVMMPRASPQCVLCEFVMAKVESLIATNRSEAAITAALEKVCNIMPQTVRAECDNFVATYMPQVIKILVAEISPGRVCSVLGLCAGETEHLDVERRNTPAACNLMVRYLHVLAKELHMSLKDVVHRVCNFLPRSERPACRQFIADHKHRILRMKKSDFVVKFHPARMCQKLQGHRRRRPTGLVQLLGGGSKCTYGPAYWCATLANAQECGAITHCRQHVWRKTGGLL